jgi:hypothetical protein
MRRRRAAGLRFHLPRGLKVRLVLYNVEDFRDIIFVHSILTQTVVLFFMSILQGNLQHEYTGSNCVQLSGCETLSELTELLRYLNLCFYFSKKPFPAFLEFGGYDQDSVLLHMPKARVHKYCDMNFFPLIMVWLHHDLL